MISRLISPKDSEFKVVEDHILTDFGRDPALLGLYKPETYIIGRFDDEELTGFGIFEDYKDPKFHIGNMHDEAFTERMMSLENYLLYNVSLIHEFTKREDPSDAARGVISAIHDILGIKNGRFCLFITLMEEANKQAMPFFESMGFKFVGSSSFYMEIPVSKAPAPAFDKWEFISVDSVDPTKLASCYVDIFGGRNMDWYKALGMILATRGFDNQLSFAALDPKSRDVKGFCLLQRTSPDEVYIMAMGVDQSTRGQGLTNEGYSFLRHTLNEEGIKKAVFVTSFKRLAEHFNENHDARLVDRMMWYSLCK